jgi:hypothetical protein
MPDDTGGKARERRGVSKASVNRQRARERIAAERARAARRRRLWLAGGGGGAAVVAAGVAIALAVSGGGSPAGAVPPLRLAALSTLGTLRAAPAAGPAGPEGVPVPDAAALAGTAAKATGQTVDGIGCSTSEQTLFHIHAHLTVFVNGAARQVPAGIGIPGAQAQATAQGPFIDSGTCFYWLHTHAADGIIHIESPVRRSYTLGEFFDEWGQPLGPGQVGSARGHVTAIYDGRVYRGRLRDIPLTAHARIQLEVGTPLVAPESITWPSGL